MKRAWEAQEAYVNELLGLDATVNSGNRFHDPGDGTDHSHPSQNSFALIADCKCTSKLSYSVKLKELGDWTNKAFEMGKRFIMPIRFWSPEKQRAVDYVLMSLDDFAELLDKAREWDQADLRTKFGSDRTWLDYDEIRRYGNG